MINLKTYTSIFIEWCDYVIFIIFEKCEISYKVLSLFHICYVYLPYTFVIFTHCPCCAHSIHVGHTFAYWCIHIKNVIDAVCTIHLQYTTWFQVVIDVCKYTIIHRYNNRLSYFDLSVFLFVFIFIFMFSFLLFFCIFFVYALWLLYCICQIISG